MTFIKNLLSGAIGRFIRSAVSLGIGMLIAKYQDNAWYISAAPLLQAISKKLRDTYPDTFDWLPF